MKIPTVHRNGTSQEVLLDQVFAAGSAARELLAALDDACPNGRDYYPQGDGALHEAIAEHTDRIQRVRSVLEELQALAEAIADQGANR